jgi:hypothetical protein
VLDSSDGVDREEYPSHDRQEKVGHRLQARLGDEREKVAREPAGSRPITR